MKNNFMEWKTILWNKNNVIEWGSMRKIRNNAVGKNPMHLKFELIHFWKLTKKIIV